MSSKFKRSLTRLPLHWLSIFQSLCIGIYYLLYPDAFDMALLYNLFNDPFEDRILLIALTVVTLVMMYSILRYNHLLLVTTTIITGSLYGILIMYCIRHIIVYSSPTSSILFSLPGLVCIVLAAIMEE